MLNEHSNYLRLFSYKLSVSIMTTTFEAKYQMSLYIPKVFSNIPAKRIIQIFQSKGLGEVERVDFADKIKEDGSNQRQAFIHMRHWYNTYEARVFNEELEHQGACHVTYDRPWYWIVLPAKEPMTRREVELAQKNRELEERMAELEFQQATMLLMIEELQGQLKNGWPAPPSSPVDISDDEIQRRLADLTMDKEYAAPALPATEATAGNVLSRTDASRSASDIEAENEAANWEAQWRREWMMNKPGFPPAHAPEPPHLKRSSGEGDSDDEDDVSYPPEGGVSFIRNGAFDGDKIYDQDGTMYIWKRCADSEEFEWQLAVNPAHG